MVKPEKKSFLVIWKTLFLVSSIFHNHSIKINNKSVYFYEDALADKYNATKKDVEREVQRVLHNLADLYAKKMKKSKKTKLKN